MPAFFSALSIKTLGWLLLVLLVTTFSFGALTVVMYQRQTENKETLRDVREALLKEEGAVKEKEKALNGCLGAIRDINQSIAENAQQATLLDQQRQSLASSHIGHLPALIQKDRQISKKPAAATAWVKELLQ